jgi:hypothetical protein
MNEIAELSQTARNILRESIYQQKEYEYAHGILTGLVLGTIICTTVFIIYIY